MMIPQDKSKKRIHYFQHVPYEGLDRIGDWAALRGHHVTRTAFHSKPILPSMDNWDLLCVMGGPMGVYEADQIPWMKEELAYIKEAIARGKRVLGICLGSQLIAGALGAKVYPHTQKEIGWWPINFTPQAAATELAVFGRSSVMYHWHADTFDLPPGATLLASSAGCKNQAYAVGPNVVALQFHPEISFDTIGRWVKESTSIQTPGGFIQSEEEMKRLAQAYLAALQSPLYQFMDAMAGEESKLAGLIYGG
jgi:GMP synthase-like glutamine amidotransferase